MRRILILFIRGYQLALSPLFPPSCRFLPTCSEYAKQSLEVHGPIKGLILTAWRLLRCHPLCAGGYDPVPDSWPDKPAPSNPDNRPVAVNLNPPIS